MRSENESGNISCKITNIINVYDSIYISFGKRRKTYSLNLNINMKLKDFLIILKKKQF